MTAKEKKQLIRDIADIQQTPIPERWRKARDLAIKINPLLAKEHEIHLKEVMTLREQQDRDDASSADGRLRFSVSVPISMMEVIRQFDPKFMSWDKRSYKDVKDSNKEARRLMKVFPEYKIPRTGN